MSQTSVQALQSQLFSNLDYNQFLGKNNQIRLKKVKDAIKNLRSFTNEQLMEIFRIWNSSNEYMLLESKKTKKRIAVKCSKRGNDVYKFRIDQRFRELDVLAKRLGNDRIFLIGENNPQTNILFITLTYDTKMCSQYEAWTNIGIEWNRYLSLIVRKHGKISFVRSWEAFKNGYPHIHVVIIFKEKKFNVFEFVNSQNKTTFRIQEKKELECNWHSYVDVIAVSSLGGALRYLTKYLRKMHGRGSGVNLTQALSWINHKQVFSISKDFVKEIRLVYKLLHNSNVKTKQITFEGTLLSEWEFLGIYPEEKFKELRNNERHPWTFETDFLVESKEDKIRKKEDYVLYIANAGFGF